MNGIPFVFSVTFAIAAAVAATFAVAGFDEESVRMVLRLTARTSLLLFLAAFSASAVRRVWKNRFSGWMRRNRRYLGLGFAASHTIHLGAIAALTRFGVEFDATTLVIGGIGYGFVLLLAVTSNDFAVRSLGVWWRRLHTVGVYYLWFVFAATYAPTVPAYPAADIGEALLLAALGLRVWALRGRGAR